jgi:hypothetical protein
VRVDPDDHVAGTCGRGQYHANRGSLPNRPRAR